MQWGSYLAYVKDNPEGYWFKRRPYGLGWIPATKEGWFVLCIFMGFILFTAFTSFGPVEPTTEELHWFLLKILGAVGLLLAICYRTGEPLKWMWGFPDEDRGGKNSPG